MALYSSGLTAAELIEVLRQFRPNTPVVVTVRIGDDDEGLMPVTRAQEIDDLRVIWGKPVIELLVWPA